MREGQKSGHQACTNSTGKKAQDLRLQADPGRQLQVLQCIGVTVVRPDMVLYSECEHIVYFIELTVPLDERLRKPLKGRS